MRLISIWAWLAALAENARWLDLLYVFLDRVEGEMAFSCLLSEEEQIAVRRSRAIDRQLKSLDRQKNWQHESKILLLGAGESGKSTFVKQMRIIHGEDYTDEDRLEFRSLIYHNILKGMKVLVEARKRLQIPLANPENESNGEKISSSYRRAQELSPEEFQTVLPFLKSLADDKGIQNTLLRSNEFQLVGGWLLGMEWANVEHVKRREIPVGVCEWLFLF